MTKKQFEAMHWFYENMTRLGFTRDEADTLRRIEMTLQRWGERECGDGYGRIERDDTTGKPYWLNSNTMRRYPIADKESGALKRLGKIMAVHTELVAYHQGDCRGCNLYILRKSDIKPGEDIGSVYTRGVAVCC